jgi:hypothetical protein
MNGLVEFWRPVLLLQQQEAQGFVAGVLFQCSLEDGDGEREGDAGQSSASSSSVTYNCSGREPLRG